MILVSEMSRAIYTLIHIQIWTSSIWCPTQETRGRDKDSYNEGVSGNKGGPIGSKVDDLNTGNHDTKSTSKGNIHEILKKGVIIIYSQICHLTTIVIAFILEVQSSTIKNISSSSFVSNQSSTQRNQNFGDGDLQTGSCKRE